MLIGLAVTIAFGIENWQRKRFFFAADKFGDNIEEKAGKAKSPVIFRLLAIIAILVFSVILLIVGSALWPVNVYAMYRTKKMGK